MLHVHDINLGFVSHCVQPLRTRRPRVFSVFMNIWINSTPLFLFYMYPIFLSVSLSWLGLGTLLDSMLSLLPKIIR